MARADGSGYHTLQQKSGGDYLAWSPDGTHLTYAPFPRNRTYGLGILDVRTSHWRKTSIGYAVEGTPAWSPDGKQLAFVGALQQGDREHLIVATHDGWGWEAHYVADFDANSSSLMWSRDNRLLIISCLPPPGDGCR